MSLIDIKDFLQRTSERIGFVREQFEDRKLPKDVSDIVALPFFGDVRAACVLSSLLLHRYREEVKGSKYFIVCSWPGLHGLFPCVDEYWSPVDTSQIKKLSVGAEGFFNKSDVAAVNNINILDHFHNVLNVKELSQFYENGLKQEFWDKFKHVKRFLPQVPSSAILGNAFNREVATKAGYKVFIHPSTCVSSWKYGKQQWSSISKVFWVELVKRLLKDGFVPVLWKNDMAYDLSSEFTDQCIYFVDNDIVKVLSAMRSVGCVLDVFNGTSRLAILARCPFLALDERQRYMETKDWEIDDLVGPQVPKEYIFTFATMIDEGNQYGWDQTLFNNISSRLNDFLPALNRDQWPLTAESLEIVPYKTVRERKVRKIGARLLKIPRD